MNIESYSKKLNRLKDFILLLNEKNPELKIELHTSFSDFPNEYENGKYIAGAHKASSKHGVFILKVNDDFDLPFEQFHELMIGCNSWRNNSLSRYISEEDKEREKNTVPSDFDVIRTSGDLKKPGIDNSSLYIYVIGGCAKSINTQKTL